MPLTGIRRFRDARLRPLRYLSVRPDRLKRTLHYTWHQRRGLKSTGTGTPRSVPYPRQSYETSPAKPDTTTGLFSRQVGRVRDLHCLDPDTGKRAVHSAKTIGELVNQHQSRALTPLPTIVSDRQPCSMSCTRHTFACDTWRATWSSLWNCARPTGSVSSSAAAASARRADRASGRLRGYLARRRLFRGGEPAVRRRDMLNGIVGGGRVALLVAPAVMASLVAWPQEGQNLPESGIRPRSANKSRRNSSQ